MDVRKSISSNVYVYFCLISGWVVFGTYWWVHIHDFRNCKASIYGTYFSYGFTYVRVHKKFTSTVRCVVDIHVWDI